MRRPLTIAALLLASVVLIFIGMALALDAGCCRQSVIKFASAQLHRPVAVAGALDLHLLAFRPWVKAEGVTIGNPAWLPAGPAVSIGTLSVRFRTPRLAEPVSFAEVSARDARLILTRNLAGVANWTLDPPSEQSRSELPIVHSLLVPQARVMLDDEIRHLHFRGELSVDEAPRPDGTAAMRLLARGQLNDRPVVMSAVGDPLANARHERPYGFTFYEASSGSTLQGHGQLQRPFSLRQMNAQFSAAGDNLRNLYFLVGVSLINTGHYQLSGRFERQGSMFQYRDLSIKSGESDLRGDVAIVSAGATPVIAARFESRLLRTIDIGTRAAGEEDTGPRLLLSNAKFSRNALLRTESTLDYRAQRVQIGRVPLLRVSAKAAIHQGVLIVSPFSAELYEGRLHTHLRIDAKPDIPVADVDIKMNDVQLSAMRPSKPTPPAIEGALRGRLRLHGYGRSIHEVAASGTGQLAAILPHGALRASLAELIGLDLRGVGLLLSKNMKDTAIRCGVASFEARAGTLTSQALLLDTDLVRVAGSGQLDLESEALDLKFQGHPKHPRLLRLHSALVLRGTLTHPKVGLQGRSVAGQTAAAIALGVVLTPLASVLAFVDPGLDQGLNCAAVIDSTTADLR